MDEDTEIEFGEIIASSESLRFREDAREEMFLRLSYFFQEYIEKCRASCSSYSKTPGVKCAYVEGTFQILWSPLDEHSRIEAIIAGHFQGSKS